MSQGNPKKASSDMLAGHVAGPFRRVASDSCLKPLPAPCDPVPGSQYRTGADNVGRPA